MKIQGSEGTWLVNYYKNPTAIIWTKDQTKARDFDEKEVAEIMEILNDTQTIWPKTNNN
jgi:hypothetical protein